MRVVHISSKILIVADRVLPVSPLPHAEFAVWGHAGDRGSPFDTDFENAILIARQRPGKRQGRPDRLAEETAGHSAGAWQMRLLSRG